jgi:hypothetical protein
MRLGWLVIPSSFFAFVALAGCGPKQRFTDAEIPKLEKLSDVMWSQAQAMDPSFKKIGRASYVEEDWTGFGAGAARLKLTTARIKEPAFSKGAEFNALADKLATRAEEIAAAASAKDVARVTAALQATKDTCKECHKKFR